MKFIKPILVILFIYVSIPMLMADTQTLTIKGKQYSIVDGDIVVSNKHLNNRTSGETNPFAEDKFWPGGIIPYQWDVGFSSSQKSLIRTQMNTWENKANIKFVERNPGNESHFPDFVEIIYAEQTCLASRGRQGGVQFLVLGEGEGPNDCMSEYAILHELGHVIGMVHEHQRTIRDDYLSTIRCPYGCDKHSSESLMNLGKMYDYDSISHYHTEEDRTLKACDLQENGTCLENDRLVGGSTISPLDVATVNKVYGANICLQASNGSYVATEDHNAQYRVNANRGSCGPWEKHNLVDINGGFLNSGDKVTIKSSHQRLWSAQAHGGLDGNREIPGAWETFTIIKKNGYGRILPGDKVAFKTAHNKYIRAKNGGGSDMDANANSSGTYGATFTYTDPGDISDTYARAAVRPGEWALLSFPINFQSNKNKPYLVFNHIHLNNVYAFDANYGWQKYSPSSPPFANTLKTMNRVKGYWVKNIHNTEASITIAGNQLSSSGITLRTGWNLVGYPSQNEKSTESVLSSILSKVSSVYSFDEQRGTWLKYSPSSPPFANTLKTFKPTQGYWIQVNRDVYLQF